MDLGHFDPAALPMEAKLMKAARFLGTRRMLSRSPYGAKMAVTCASRRPSATLATYLKAQG